MEEFSSIHTIRPNLCTRQYGEQSFLELSGIYISSNKRIYASRTRFFLNQHDDQSFVFLHQLALTILLLIIIKVLYLRLSLLGLPLHFR